MLKNFYKIIILALLGIIAFLSYVTFIKEKEITDQQLRERIGQMLIVGFRGAEALEYSYIDRIMKDINIGGIVLFDIDTPSGDFPRNIVNPAQTANLIRDIQIFSPTPLFVAVDAEGGNVNRLEKRYGFIPVPSAQEIGGRDDLDQTEKIASELAFQLSNLGFNLNFAPVVDVNINPDNPAVGKFERSFSRDAEKVTEQAIAFIDAHHKEGIITAIKHFPGHGSSKDDSHYDEVDITDTYRGSEIIPFQKIIEQGKADMVMTAHIINKDVDSEYPATLSPLFIKNILRNQLGFQGVVVSDDMQMGAIAEYYDFDKAIIRAINAGCDIILISNNIDVYDESMPYRARDIIFEAVKEGAISVDSIVESSDRIYALKKKFNIIK